METPTGAYPLLEALLFAKQVAVKAVWTIGDVAALFGVRNRAIYDWISSGKIAARDLPGRGRFLSVDLEEFLRNSKRARVTHHGKRGV